jgi:purine-binding chemotaxis protein CheW
MVIRSTNRISPTSEARGLAMSAAVATPDLQDRAVQLVERHTELVSSRQVLCLAVGRETYGIGIDMVREILEVTRLTPLPLTPPFVRGVMNLRGAVVPVIDLQARFGGRAAEIGRRSAIVIVETCHHDQEGPLVVGALVDGVTEVLDILNQDVEPVPPLGTRIPREFLQGMAKAKGTLLSLLDMDRTLDRETLASLIGGHLTFSGQGHNHPHLEAAGAQARDTHADL